MPAKYNPSTLPSNEHNDLSRAKDKNKQCLVLYTIYAPQWVDNG